MLSLIIQDLCTELPLSFQPLLHALPTITFFETISWSAFDKAILPAEPRIIMYGINQREQGPKTFVNSM